MRPRLAAIGMAVLLVAALVPSALGQPIALPRASEAADHEVLAFDVPIGPQGSGSLRVPLADGMLDIRLEPLPIAAGQSSADAQAYLAQATFLLPDGVSLPLPTMVIVPEASAASGAAASELEAFADEADRLRRVLEDLHADPATDALGPHIADLNARLEALALQAAAAVALAEAAAANAGVVAAEQAVIAQSLVTMADDLLSMLAPEVQQLRRDIANLTEEPPSSGSSSSSSSPPTPSSSTSSSSAPPPTPPPAPQEIEEARQGLLEGLADASRQLNETQQAADAARSGVTDSITGAGGWAGAVAGRIADRAHENATAAVVAALLALEFAKQGATNASLLAADIGRDAHDDASSNATAGQDAAARNATAAHAAAQAKAEELQGQLEAAADRIASAQQAAPGFAQAALHAAGQSVASARRGADAMVALLQQHAPAEANAASDEAQAQLEAARSSLPPEIQAAIAALEDAAGSPDAAVGGLLILPDIAMDDADGLAVCADHAGSQACLAFMASAEQPLGAVRVLVAVPALGELAIDLPGSATSLTSSPPAVPVPPLPLPTGVPLPGASGSSSPSPSPSASSTSSSSSESSSAAPDDASSSSSTSTSSSHSSSSQGDQAGAPRLSVSADRDALSMVMGQQESLQVTVRNDGDAADRVHVTAQSSAPVSLDSATEGFDLGPGEQRTLLLRVTPTAAGSGAIDLVATGDKAGSVRDAVQVQVAQAAPSAAAIQVSLEPAALRAAVDQAVAVTVRIANDGPVADRVRVEVSAAGVLVDPASLQVDLQPGESAVREVRLLAERAGEHAMSVAIHSDRGADLRPLLTLDAGGALQPAAGDAAGGDDQAPSPRKAKDTPAAGALAIVAVALLAVAIRRRLE